MARTLIDFLLFHFETARERVIATCIPSSQALSPKRN